MNGSLHIVKPGLLTTIQDVGRWGLQARGVPPAGPMDPWSHRVANALVGNGRDAATLEITLLGPELAFGDERLVAVAGAQFAVSVNGEVQATDRAFVVPAGAHLQFSARARGARAYVAIAGGITTPPVLGSRATHLVSRLGGLEGRALAAGDTVPLGEVRPDGRPGTVLLDGPGHSLPAIAAPGEAVRLRVLPGPHRDRFSDDALDVLQAGPYVIDRDSNRMGFRLQGAAIRHTRGADIISDATPLGALQVPASQQPMLLMADRQTTGGYPILAALISADVGLAGQLAPGDRVLFEVCTMREALAALIAQESRLMTLETLPHHE